MAAGCAGSVPAGQRAAPGAGACSRWPDATSDAVPLGQARSRRYRLRWLFAALAAGPIGAFSAACLWPVLALPVPRVAASAGLLVQWLVVAPVLEELAFRGWLHDALLASRSGRPRFGAASVGPLTLANVLASLAFAVCHLPLHSPWLAGAVFVPSLVFGRLKEAWDSVVPAIAVHATYNLAFIAAFAR